MARPGTIALADIADATPNDTIAGLGEQATWEALNATFNAHNELTTELGGFLMTRGSNKSDPGIGGSDSSAPEELDEQGLPRAEKFTTGESLSYPLKAYGKALNWTSMAFQKIKLAMFNAQVKLILDGDVRNIYYQMKLALYGPANYQVRDTLDDHTTLSIKRLTNGDGAMIFPGPDGVTFPNNHTHYLGRAGGSWVESDLVALIQTVREHTRSGGVQVWVTKADATTIRGFTGFEPYTDPRLVMPITETRTRRTLDMNNTSNRAIGILDDAEIWVRPWAVTNYPTAINVGLEPPLRYRFDPVYGDGLQLVYDNPDYPLRSKAWRRIFGIGVKNRTVAAIQYTGGTSYVAPTISY